MDTLNILGIGLILAICGLIAIYIFAYILAIILWEISFTRKIICNIFQYEYKDFPKYCNTRNNGGNQRYVFYRIHNYIKCFPIACYRLWRQDSLRGKPIGDKRNNNTEQALVVQPLLFSISSCIITLNKDDHHTSLVLCATSV